MMLYTQYKSSGSCILKTFFYAVTYYATAVGSGPPWNHSGEFWSKIQLTVSEEKMFKEIVDARTDARTDDGRRTKGHHKSSS